MTNLLILCVVAFILGQEVRKSVAITIAVWIISGDVLYSCCGEVFNSSDKPRMGAFVAGLAQN